MTQAEFARHRGVSKAIVTKWKGQGLLTLMEDGKVDVEASEWNLDQRPANYRGGTTHRPVRTVPKAEPDPREIPAGRPKPEVVRADPVAPRPAGDRPVRDFDPDDPDLELPEALRRKENFLGLQRKQAYEIEQGRLVNREAAEKLFFDTARDLRDAWATWPSRIATIMADELGVDARRLNTVLTAHVQQHLDQLGEPEATLSRP
ncbi:hypothetical protein [Methylobacterium gossipiicola]|uniref:Uncharacterized protein n=1 Tax=Methylobacterium gossipiicola TaxID=582675 RepID=A0A1I2VUI6_9HYPH|nr:hypothetical protein [Methylobacterium gossipiicola]SFG92773.1 hypothetical protein SAMN05192565_11789 [Methylobacterium gossipiicola]